MPNIGATYHTAAYECDQNCLLQLATIFNWLQDSMDKYSREQNLGYDFCKKNNMTYILKDYDVTIDTLPKWMDSVSIATKLVRITPCSLFLQQTMTNSQTKQSLLSSISHIVLIDLLKKRPIHNMGAVPLHLLEISPMMVRSPSLPPLNIIHNRRIQEITSDYIDFNQHVNNTHYVVFAERTLDSNLYKKEKLKRIQVAYKQAAVLGDTLKVESKISPELTDHQISSATDSAKQFAQVRFFWNRDSR